MYLQSVIFVLAISVLGLLSYNLIFDLKHPHYIAQAIGVEVLKGNLSHSERSQALSQLTSTVFSVYVGAILAFLSSAISLLVAIFIFRKVSTYQNLLQKLDYLKQIEDDMLKLFNQKFGRIERADSVEFYRFRNCLNEAEWDSNFSNATAIQRHYYVDGDNFVLIRGDGMRLSSVALHETLIWFRRINRALYFRIISVEDIVPMWRFVLPFSASGRFVFFSNYFGRDDFTAISSVCQSVFIYMVQKRVGFPANYVNTIDEAFLKSVGVSRASINTY